MSALGFAEPAILLALIPIWILALLRWGRPRKTRRSLPLSRLSMAQNILRTRPFLRVLISAPNIARLLALSLIVLALARPQSTDNRLVSGEGIDIMFALDMSGSMNAVDLAEDGIYAYHAQGKEPPNRFELARDILIRFVKARREDRIGLSIFGKDAYLKFPLTLDYDRILNNLEGLVLDDGRRSEGEQCMNECTIDGGGTAIGDALARCYRRLRKSTGKSRVIVLITDGKNEGGSVDPDTLADELARLPEGERIRVFTLLVGDPSLTKLPVTEPFSQNFARDNAGNLIYRAPDRSFDTDESLLQRVAERTGGIFWKTPDEETFRAAFTDLEKTLFEREVTVRHKELFLFPLLAAIALLVFEMLLQIMVLRRFP